MACSRLDVVDADAVAAAAACVEAELGPIDVWVNNAMTAVLAWWWPDEGLAAADQADEAERLTRR